MFNAKIPLLLFALSTLSLTACSSDPAAPQIDVTTSAPAAYRPGPPAPIKLERVNWQACGASFCVTAPELKKTFRNKVAVGRWMSSARVTIQYYQKLGAPAANP